MAEQPNNPVEPTPLGEVSWRTSWQLPALGGAVLLLVGGITAAVLTAPKPNFEKFLEQAEGLIDKGEYEAARQEVLEKRLLPYLNANQLSAEHRKRFHINRARTITLADKKIGLESHKNAELVIEDYAAADPDGASLEPMDRYFLADANVTLGRFDRGLTLAEGLPASERTNKARIVRRVVEERLKSPRVDADETLRVIADFLKDTELPAAERAWALARQAEVLRAQGLTERAIAKLLQTMPSLIADAGPDRLSELYLLLGRSYWEMGALSDATRQLTQAAALLPESSVQRAEAELLLTRIAEQTRSSPEEHRAEARQRYGEIAEQFAGTPAGLAALLGLAEVASAAGDDEGAFAAYARLVEAIAAGRKGMDLTAESVAGSLLDRYSSRMNAGEHAAALRYASLAERVFPRDGATPDVLRAVAMAHRQAAEARLKDGSERMTELSRLDPATREQARLDLIGAARYFKRHAERVGISDNTAYGGSLWMAADSFDLAGDAESAIPLFLDYVKFFPGEPRQAEGRFRLGQSYQSRGDYGSAANMYQGLIAEASRPDGIVGPYADLSYVPLSQCLLMDADPSNDAAAEGLLQRVVSGSVGATQTAQFRDALVVLGTLERRRGDYAGAITHLEEAVARFPADSRIDDLRYSLADSYRQDAKAIASKLNEGMPDTRKHALREARLERLGKAMVLFEQVRASLDARDQRRLSDLERLELRNSYFYLGDCAFDLRDYETAIRHYDAARERYPKDPASLVAMIQIVNAYVEIGDTQRAQTANYRAKAFYDSLPEAAWNDPNLPMSKEDWQRWLDSMQKLRPIGAAAAGPSGEDH